MSSVQGNKRTSFSFSLLNFINVWFIAKFINGGCNEGNKRVISRHFISFKFT